MAIESIKTIKIESDFKTHQLSRVVLPGSPMSFETFFVVFLDDYRGNGDHC